MTNTIIIVKNYGYGIATSDKGQDLIFNYDVPGDEGMGVIQDYNTGYAETIVDLLYNEDGDVIKIIIK